MISSNVQIIQSSSKIVWIEYANDDGETLLLGALDDVLGLLGLLLGDLLSLDGARELGRKAEISDRNIV
jgi:hypothetical protein